MLMFNEQERVIASAWYCKGSFYGYLDAQQYDENLLQLTLCFLSSYYNSAVGRAAELLARVGGRDIAARPKLNSRPPAFRLHSAYGDGGDWLQALFFFFPFDFISFDF
jgi:hypothetical protein